MSNEERNGAERNSVAGDGQTNALSALRTAVALISACQPDGLDSADRYALAGASLNDIDPPLLVVALAQFALTYANQCAASVNVVPQRLLNELGLAFARLDA